MPAVEKIREAIGWEPSLELDLILADVIKHIRTAPVPLPRTRPRFGAVRPL